MPIPALVGAAAISGGASLIGSIFGSGSRRRAQRRQNAANMQLAEYQYSRDLEMWNRQNRYNSPEAQMQRLQKAKLNPNLVYGTGTVAGNTSGQMPKYQAPTADHKAFPIDFTQVIGQYQNMKLANAQTSNIQAQTKIAEQRALNEAINNDILTTRAKQKGFDLEKSQALYPYQFDMTKTKTEQETQKLSNLEADHALKLSVNDEKQLEIAFKRHRNRLAEKGIYQSDNLLFRMIALHAKTNGISVQKAIQQYLNEQRNKFLPWK